MEYAARHRWNLCRARPSSTVALTTVVPCYTALQTVSFSDFSQCRMLLRGWSLACGERSTSRQPLSLCTGYRFGNGWHTSWQLWCINASMAVLRSTNTKYKYKANLYSAVSRKRIGVCGVEWDSDTTWQSYVMQAVIKLFSKYCNICDDDHSTCTSRTDRQPT